MGERAIISGGDELREIALGEAAGQRRVALAGAGTLCAGRECLYAAGDGDDVIWRIDSGLLVPTGLFAGGPGMCRLCLSPDEARLYALCGDADSLLMLCAQTGAPQMLNRVGVAPCEMVMDEAGEVIAVAGGACGEIILLSARTLGVTARLETPGVAFSVAMGPQAIYALSLSEEMTSTLTTFLPAGGRRALALPGLPGAVVCIGGRVLVATHGHLFTVDRDGSRVLAARGTPGRAARLVGARGGVLAIDMWSDALSLLPLPQGRERVVARAVRDAIVLS